MSNEIERVELVTEYVEADLSASTFSDEERERVLDAIDELEEQLVTWGRSLHTSTKILQGTGGETVYCHRAGDLRSYFIREENTLYCIGVGKRKTTYDRDLDTIVERAIAEREDGSE